MNMYAVSSSHPAKFLILKSVSKMFTEMVFSTFSGDQDTCPSGCHSPILIRFFGLQLPSTILILLHRLGLVKQLPRNARPFSRKLRVTQQHAPGGLRRKQSGRAGTR